MEECKSILDFLFEHRDEKYRAFQGPLIPQVSGASMIGVRTPVLRSYAKELVKKRMGRMSGTGGTAFTGGVDAPDTTDTHAAPEEIVRSFLEQLPHTYFEENQLHSFIISLTRDFDQCVSQVKAFLPFVDNWATCDQLSPKVFAKNPRRLLPLIEEWLSSSRVYTVRFGIACLMRYFLDEEFERVYLEKVCAVQNDDYYVKMMKAWYFATALAKQWDAALPFIGEHRLDPWTEKMTVRKARESYRVSEEHKNLLKALQETGKVV